MRENRQLTKAKSAKNDEFYTQYNDIQKEVNAYFDFNPDTFRGKTVLLPCDDPEWSKFTRRNGDITCGGLGQTALPHVVAQFKRLLSRRYGLRFQRDFWDTRLRDDAHYAEKFRYVCNNPVRRGLCAAAREWPHVIAFDRTSGEERPHRNNVNEKGTPP